MAFPEALVPLSQHPKIIAAGFKDKILAYRLLSHLHFTSILELNHVNPVCARLARGAGRVELSLAERNDALRIYCDEGGHALFVELLATKIEAHYGVDRNLLGRPEFDLKMEKILSLAESEAEAQVLQEFFVTVSETLVTKILRDIPYAPGVAPAVKSVIGDHAADEACHSVFFRWYFPRLWNSLSAAERPVIGRRLPDFIWAFLAPDADVDRRVLQGLGFGASEIEEMLEDVYPTSVVSESVRQAAAPTLEMMRSAAVWEGLEVYDSFAKQNLIR